MCRCDGGVDGYVGVAIVAGCVGAGVFGVAVAASGVINSSVVVVVGGGVVCVGDAYGVYVGVVISISIVGVGGVVCWWYCRC